MIIIDYDAFIGKKVNKLTIMSFSNNSSGYKIVTVECECGIIKEFGWQNFKKGNTLSCGCLKITDLTGNTYNKLTVLSQHGKNKFNQITWLCRCECGVEKIVSGNVLTSGKVKSCGCVLRSSKLTMEKFMNLVYPEPNTGCWLWGGYTDIHGYGTIMSSQIKSIRAHRVSYYLHFGNFDTRLIVLHKCDNPSCVNPEHLKLGTNKENTEDMINKKRNKVGINHHSAKLNDDIVREIRELYKTGDYTQKELAIKYNVSTMPIYDILRKRTWVHVI